eukprot:4641387-Heterocapsa_arctica.AAC.1
MHALIRGTTSQGVASAFRFLARPGMMSAPPGWCSVRIPSLDLDVLVPRDVYCLDWREANSRE